MTWNLQQDDSPGRATRLRQHLFDAYNGFADGRYKDCGKDHAFAVDDRGQPNDYNAHKDLHPWFCMIFVNVRVPNAVEVTMRGEVPGSVAIAQWSKAHNARSTDQPQSLSFSVPLGQEQILRELAGHVRRIVSDGNYPVASYRYMCPRTVKSLERLAEVLSTAPRAAS